MLFCVIGIAQNVSAASFDCDKATTEIEIIICENDELSALDVQIVKAYFSISVDSDFHTLVRERQIEWITDPDRINIYASEQYRDYLTFVSVLDQCLTDDHLFESCYFSLKSNEYGSCLNNDLVSTFTLNKCGGSLLNALTLFHDVMVQEQIELLSYDHETQALHQVANQRWSEYVHAECDWQKSEYRGGTVAGPIYLSCLEALYVDRIDLLDRDLRLRN